jgi:hypothetical protein
MTKKKKIQFPPEDKIPRNHTFDMCMHFNSDNRLLGYFTYLSYKEYKYDWIENFKTSKRREPTSVELENFKKDLLVADYESFIKDADDKIKVFFSQLVENEVKDRLTQEAVKSNFKELSKKNSFGRSVLASAVGTIGLILLFLFLSWAFNTGLFDKVYALIVPNLPPVSN